MGFIKFPSGSDIQKKIINRTILSFLILGLISIGVAGLSYKYTEQTSKFSTYFRFEDTNSTGVPYSVFLYCFFECDGILCAQHPFYLTKIEIRPPSQLFLNITWLELQLTIPYRWGKGKLWLNESFPTEYRRTPHVVFTPEQSNGTEFMFYFEGNYELSSLLYIGGPGFGYYISNLSANSTPLKVESYEKYNAYKSSRLTMSSIIFAVVFVSLPTTYLTLLKINREHKKVG